jgi:hypothetical protein
MSKDEQDLEAEIVDKGLTAPRITPEMVDEEIVGAQYHVFEVSCLTVCCLTLRNGFTVIGQSACASPENFDEDVGRKVSYSNARQQVRPFLAFRLRDQLA